MKINIVEREGYSNRIMNWKIYEEGSDSSQGIGILL